MNRDSHDGERAGLEAECDALEEAVGDLRHELRRAKDALMRARDRSAPVEKRIREMQAAIALNGRDLMRVSASMAAANTHGDRHD